MRSTTTNGVSRNGSKVINGSSYKRESNESIILTRYRVSTSDVSLKQTKGQ